VQRVETRSVVSARWIRIVGHPARAVPVILRERSESQDPYPVILREAAESTIMK
jgi:hypothetical protein